MSVLASLARAYDRMAADGLVPPYGYSTENIAFVIALNPDGTPASLPIDKRIPSGKKWKPARLPVPMGGKRTSGVSANFLWDKTSYALGVSAGPGRRLTEEHEAFKNLHREALQGTDDEGLLALLRFLDLWTPERFTEWGWPEEMLDQNLVFALESERLRRLLHDRPAARAIWTRRQGSADDKPRPCLVTGEPGPVARLHPAIKGVWGAQSSGASLVSFNLDAFTSYGKEQGDNAQIGEAAAFAYASALNRFLEQGSGHRIQIGDASTVFWADGTDAEASAEAETLFSGMFAKIDDAAQAARIQPILDNLRQGRPIRDFAPNLAEGVRFHVLGLAPNAARLSVRFWLDSDFSEVARNYARFRQDIAVEPGPQNPDLGLWGYLVQTAVQRKSENIPPNLAADWMRAILTGGPYPLTLLATVLMRMRADGAITAERVGILKAVLIRGLGVKPEEVPVALNIENSERGYLLGRLFAVLERAQTIALGNINATIKDKFYGAASAQPGRVFPVLVKAAQPHFAKLVKTAPGANVMLDKLMGEIMGHLDPDGDPFPRMLSPRDQGLFALGYYHQRQSFFTPQRRPDAAPAPAEMES